MLVYFGICWKISGRSKWNRNEKDFPQAYCNILSVGIRVLVSEQMSFFQLVCIWYEPCRSDLGISKLWWAMVGSRTVTQTAKIVKFCKWVMGVNATQIYVRPHWTSSKWSSNHGDSTTKTCSIHEIHEDLSNQQTWWNCHEMAME
jgi:hypothetical protein